MTKPEIITAEDLSTYKSTHLNELNDYSNSLLDFTAETDNEKPEEKLFKEIVDMFVTELVVEANQLSVQEVTATNVQEIKNLALLCGGLNEALLGSNKPSFGVHARYKELLLSEEEIGDDKTPGEWTLEFVYGKDKEGCTMEIGIFPQAIEEFTDRGMPGEQKTSIPAKLEFTIRVPGRPAMALILEPASYDGVDTINVHEQEINFGQYFDGKETRKRLTFNTTADKFAQVMQNFKQYLQNKADPQQTRQSVSSII